MEIISKLIFLQIIEERLLFPTYLFDPVLADMETISSICQINIIEVRTHKSNMCALAHTQLRYLDKPVLCIYLFKQKKLFFLMKYMGAIQVRTSTIKTLSF